MPGPLAGTRVLDASTILAGPLCAQILGDYGAEVLKIEHPNHGDGMRGHGPSKAGIPLWWKQIGRNKKCLALDLSDPRGADLLVELAGTSDVLVENFRPGTLERWGIGPDRLWEANPDLIIVRITGFGQTGPYAHRRGFGTLAEAMSGFAFLTGQPDAPPTLPSFGLADSICGIAAAGAVAMALYARSRGHARGQVVDMNLISPIMACLSPQVLLYDQLGVVEQRSGNRSRSNAPRNLYATADGQWIAVSASARNVAERVMALVGREELLQESWFATGEGRAQHMDEVDGSVAEWIADRTLDEVLTAFESVGAAAAPVYSAADIVRDEHFTSTDMITSVSDADFGVLRMQNLLFNLSATPGSIRFTGRPLAQDTDEVLSELTDLDVSDLAQLREEGVIG